MFSSLFLSFLILAAGTTIEGQQQEHKPCRQPQTGSVSFPSILYVFFRGVDLTRLDPYLEEGTTLTLFNLTCDRGTRWADGSVEYLIPDQIERISTLADLSSSTERLSTPVTCFQLGCYRRKVLTANVDLDSHLKPVNGRGVMVESAEYRMEVKNDLLGNHWVFGEIHSDRLKFSVTMATAEDLRPSCFLPERLLKLLEDAGGGGGDYASNPRPYQEALRLYGTHYFASGTFGARTVELTRLRPDYYFAARAASLGNLTDNVRAHFEQRFDRLDPAYAQNVHVERSWFGRFPPPTPDKPGAYWPLAVSLKPITELLEQGHPAKAQLAVAIRVRLMRAALRDWSRSLQKMNDLGGGSWGLLMGAFQPGGLLERVNEQLAETVPEEAAVEAIGGLVETMEDFIGLMNDHTLKG